MRKSLIALMILLYMGMTFVEAKDEASEKNKEDAIDETATSITVYIDAPFGNRKKGSIKRINKSHKKYQAKGYQMIDMQAYTENGDLEGFFVSYVKIKK